MPLGLFPLDFTVNVKSSYNGWNMTKMPKNSCECLRSQDFSPITFLLFLKAKHCRDTMVQLTLPSLNLLLYQIQSQN